jgi:hypothetical protein
MAVWQHTVEQGFFTQPVTCQEQAIQMAIEQRSCEHPVDRLKHLKPTVQVKKRQHLAVGFCTEFVAFRQMRTQVAMVIYLAVGYRTDTAILRMKRLGATLDIDNGKTPEYQTQIVPNRYPGIVRTTMLHCIAHALKNQAIFRLR